MAAIGFAAVIRGQSPLLQVESIHRRPKSEDLGIDIINWSRSYNHVRFQRES